MARRIFRKFRRRRRMPETYTFRQCRTCYNVYGAMPCNAPMQDVIHLLGMATQRNPTLVDTTELTSGSDKFIVFDGMKFQNDWLHDPAKTQSCFLPTPTFPNADQLVFILSIWEALMVLPYVQGSNITPAYLPNLTSGSLQQGDLADRVLWKRITQMRIFGIRAAVGPLPFLEITDFFTGHGPVAVKSRVKLDDRHGLYLVRNFVHDIFLPFSAGGPCGTDFDCDNCGSNNDQPSCGVIPIENNFYAKMFYHSRK